MTPGLTTGRCRLSFSRPGAPISSRQAWPPTPTTSGGTTADRRPGIVAPCGRRDANRDRLPTLYGALNRIMALGIELVELRRLPDGMNLGGTTVRLMTAPA